MPQDLQIGQAPSFNHPTQRLKQGLLLSVHNNIWSIQTPDGKTLKIPHKWILGVAIQPFPAETVFFSVLQECHGSIHEADGLLTSNFGHGSPGGPGPSFGADEEITLCVLELVCSLPTWVTTNLGLVLGALLLKQGRACILINTTSDCCISIPNISLPLQQQLDTMRKVAQDSEALWNAHHTSLMSRLLPHLGLNLSG